MVGSSEKIVAGLENRLGWEWALAVGGGLTRIGQWESDKRVFLERASNDATQV